ncbi:MAG: PH domain-containing protein, partial [Chloroflexota bacterium]|nr:PH domain-containing protein [Chloroflexota bacterium]
MIAEASDNEPIEGSQFSGQLPDEEVYIFERRYWFVLLQWTGGPVALTMGLMLVTRLVIALAESAGTSLPLLLRILLWAFIPLVGYLWTLWRFLNWSNDRFIVTDRRVIHIDEIPFIRLRRDEAPLDMIQDVTVHMRGLWQNLLYFGNVINQTAGTLGTVRFTGIRKPRKVQAIILDLMRGADREGTSTSSEGEGLRWESERLRREQMGLVLRRLFWAEPQF